MNTYEIAFAIFGLVYARRGDYRHQGKCCPHSLACGRDKSGRAGRCRPRRYCQRGSEMSIVGYAASVLKSRTCRHSSQR